MFFRDGCGAFGSSHGDDIDGLAALTEGLRAMFDAERQAIAKSWRCKLRTAKTKANKVEVHREGGLTLEYRTRLHEMMDVVTRAYGAFDRPGMYWPDGWHEDQAAYNDVLWALGGSREVRL